MQTPHVRISGVRWRRWVRQAQKLARERNFWILAIMLGGLALLHYLRPRIGLAPIGFVERHAMERVVFLLPVALASFLYGQTGGLMVLALALLVMLPRVFLVSVFPGDAFLETVAVGVVGYLLVWILATQEREKRLRQDAVTRLRAINAVSASVTGSLELGVILNSALDRTLEASQTEAGCIFLVDRMTHDLTLTACRGATANLTAETKRCPASEGLCGWVARTGKPRIVSDLTTEERSSCQLFEATGARALIAAPLMSRGRVMGVMELADPRPGRFTVEDMDLLTSIGNAIGVAVENAFLCNNIRYYAQQVTRAQEDERARIARELHDDTIQSLIVLTRQLEALAKSCQDGRAPDFHQLRQLQGLADDIIQGVRRFSRDLRPSTLDDLGLLPTLEGLAASLTEKDGIATQLYVAGDKRRLPAEMELVLFRVAQEALSNVKKHAQATHATITVTFAADQVEMAVQDNGKGFALAASVDELAVAGHLGLIGMRERARLLGGNLSIQAQPGRGAQVKICVPLPPAGQV